MISRTLFGALFCVVLLLPARLSAQLAGMRFVMSHFKSDGGGGDERLYISVSPDGLNWTALNGGAPVWQPIGWSAFGNVVRDPAIIYERGYFWVAFTSGNYGNHNGDQASFGLVKSVDLFNWTFVGEIDVAIPGGTDPLVWNPCFFQDGDGSVHVFVSINPINGSQYNLFPSMRTHETHPVNADWTQWSAPAALALPSSITNEFWAWKEGATYHAIYVDFTAGGRQVYVTSPNLLTGWSAPKALGYNGQEGGFVLKRPGGGYRFYLEPGNQNSGPITTYRWCDVDEMFSNPTIQQPVQSSIGMRNGKPTALPASILYSEWKDQKLVGVPVYQQGLTADPDGDGLANVLEFACNLDPLSSSAAVTISKKDATLSVTYQRIPILAGVTYSVEQSSDLNSWQPVESILAGESATLRTDGMEEVVVIAPATGTDRYFRLKVVYSGQ